MAFSTYVSIYMRMEDTFGNGDAFVLGPEDLITGELYGVRVETQNFLGYRDYSYVGCLSRFRTRIATCYHRSPRRGAP